MNNPKILRLYRPLILLLSLLLMLSCKDVANQNTLKPAKPAHKTASRNPLASFGNKSLHRLADKLLVNKQSVHILQLGDSHTAADIFTGQLRLRFQQRFGDGGPGMVSPMTVAGQRSNVVSFSRPGKFWQLYSTRTDARQDFPFTGLIAQPLQSPAPVSLNMKDDNSGHYRIRALYKSSAISALSLTHNGVMVLPDTQDRWQFSDARQITFPLNVTFRGQKQLQLGGWFISSLRPGVIFSATGINGATLSAWKKWQSDWLVPLAALKPDMVIMAYGTNEAFNDQLDPDLYRHQLEERLIQIREAMPDTAILLISPPDSIKNKAQSACSTREPVSLMKVIQIQKEVAEQQQILFWDWRAYMGGACSMERWSAEDKARPDMIHLSAAGYKKSADALFGQLITLLKQAQ
ncbi:hypothetical protein AC791_14785 [Klebsiella sp. RIT-PI-d]|uniref:SGNH/GDSL hydrolase family protein n=1 Tax=Klebsiella sp. RIT-PI-d TaxID=1681196 RepID=UPI00067609CD|nr:SGNH/GDSL hydrolase family protein [Klebsiella sp. RIT-PI-d]KNC09878.1 hypothetical protein AC791_14785 [Klebsiella sp. RIT-PI-d]